MSEFKQINNNERPLEEVWEEKKRLRAEMIKKEWELEELIKKELDEKFEKIKDPYEQAREIFNKQTEATKKLIVKKEKLEDGKYFAWLFFSIIVVLVLLNVFIAKINIVSGFLTYLIITVVSLVLSFILAKLLKKIAEKSIAEIMKNPEVKKFFEQESRLREMSIKARSARDKEEVELRKTKYRTDFDKIEKERRDYNKTKQLMIKKQYGDSVVFYFKKFASNCSYRIFLNGNKVCYSASEKFKVVRLNEGYQSMIVNFQSSNYSADFSYQVGLKDCPKFMIFDKVCPYFGKGKEVGSDEFERISGIKLIN